MGRDEAAKDGGLEGFDCQNGSTARPMPNHAWTAKMAGTKKRYFTY